jgi:hypothetical protein
MKGCLCLLVAAFTLLSGCAATAPEPAFRSESGAELAAVIDAVREAIVAAETREVAGFPPLKAISVKLQTTVSRSAGGEVRYLVASLAASASSEATSTLELNMKPPEILHERTLSPETLKDALAKAIVLAKAGVAEAARGDAPMAMKSISIDLRFAVQVEGTAKAGVKLVPLGLEGTASLSRERVHSVSLTYSN